MYTFLADVIVVVHFVYIALVIAGLLAVLIGWPLGWRWVRNFWLRAIHLLMIGIVVVQALLGVMCPLTVWEYNLRVAAGQDVAEGSFIGRWLHNLIFVDATPGFLTCCYVGFGLLVVASWVFVPPRWPKRKSAFPG